MDIKDDEITTIETTELVTVTGGFWGPLITQGLSMLGGMFGGGTNVGVQNGNGNRQAQGNSGQTTLGDGSPIKGGQQ